MGERALLERLAALDAGEGMGAGEGGPGGDYRDSTSAGPGPVYPPCTLTSRSGHDIPAVLLTRPLPPHPCSIAESEGVLGESPPGT